MVGRCPAVRPAIVRIHVEERSGAGEPLRLRRVEIDVVELVEILVGAIDDEKMPILLAALVDVARRAAFDPVRLADRLGRNRIERKALTGLVAEAAGFVPVPEW